MTTLTDLFPSPYLSAVDVEDKPIVTVKTVTKKSMKNRDGEDEIKPVIFFNEFEKGMVLNRTNADIIGSVLGSAIIEEWYGERIQLQSVTVEAFGKRQPAIRVVESKPVADRAKMLKRYGELFQKAKDLGVTDVESYTVPANITEAELITLGKELRAKVDAAEQF